MLSLRARSSLCASQILQTVALVIIRGMHMFDVVGTFRKIHSNQTSKDNGKASQQRYVYFRQIHVLGTFARAL